MPTLLERLEGGLGGGGFQAALSGEAGRLVGIAGQAAALRDNPAGLAGFATAIAGLAVPALPAGGGVTARIGAARTAIPAVTGGAAPAALGDLGRFGTLIASQLAPVLTRTVEAARAIEALGRAEFRCPPGAPGGGGPTPPDPPPAPPPPSGAGRLQAAEARAAEVEARLALLPDPLTPGGLIEFLAGLFAGDQSRAQAFPIPLPILDDVIQPLQTLAVWSQADPAALGAEVAATLALLRNRIRAAGPERLDAALAGAAGLQAALRRAELAGFATAYLAAGEALAAALRAGQDPAAAVADLDAAITQFEALRTAQAADFTALVPGLARGLRGAPGLVLDGLLHLAVQLEPVNPAALLAGFPRPEPADAAAAQALRDLLAPITDLIEDLAEKLDLSAIEGAVATVAGEAQAIAGQITGALATVAQETRAAFAEVQAAVAALPLDELAAEMRAGIGSAGDALRDAMLRAFAPLRDALSTAVQAIADAVDGLDPQAVADALAAAVAEIAGILQDPAVTGAVEEIRATLDGAAQAAGSLSFAPVTDEVIALIEQMASGLRALGNTELNDAIKGLLSTALAVLPPDLRPVMTPLIDEFGVVIDQGPVALLEVVRSKPQEVVDRIRAFDPGALADEVLGGPFREAVAALEAVRPSALIAPLRQELARERARLKAEAAPSRALAPLSAAFDGLLGEIDRISPDALLAPIEAAVEQAVKDVVEASPVDEVFAEINGVFATIEAVLATVQRIGDVLDRVATALGALADPNAALDAWRDGVLAKLSALPNAAALDGLLAEIGTAADGAALPALLARWDAALGTLATELDLLGAEAALAGMVALHQRLRPLVRALPSGAARTAVEAALARFDPLDPAQAGGLRAATDLARAVREGRAALAALAPDFDGLLTGPDGALTALRQGAADAGLLGGAVAAEAEAALGPVRFLFGQLGAAAVPVGAVAGAFADLHQRVTQAVANILTGPASLQAISAAVQGVVDALRNIDLGFLRESLEGVFRAVRGEIEAVGPAPLLIALDREFGEAIDTLDLDLILPAAELAALDAAVAALIGKLRAFDPATLIGDAVRPAFEDSVLPLVEALDLTPLFDALIEALRGLEGELETEMGRINTAYQALLAARPAGLGASAGVGL